MYNYCFKNLIIKYFLERKTMKNFLIHRHLNMMTKLNKNCVLFSIATCEGYILFICLLILLGVDRNN